MNIQIGPGRTLDQLVIFVLEAAVRRDDSSTIIAALIKTLVYRRRTLLWLSTAHAAALSGRQRVTLRIAQINKRTL
jgi:hypothetical protein